MITGQHLADARGRAGWTQAELAERLGTTSRSISSWENSQVPRGKEARVRDLLAAYLSVTDPEPTSHRSDFVFHDQVVRLGDHGEYILGTDQSSQPDGRTTQISIRFNFGGQGFDIPTAKFVRILQAAHRAVLAATIRDEGLREPTPDELDEYLAFHGPDDEAPDFGPDEDDLRRRRNDEKHGLLPGSYASDTATSAKTAPSEPEDNPHLQRQAARKAGTSRRSRADSTESSDKD